MYDTVSYGSTTCTYLSGCNLEDIQTDEQWEQFELYEVCDLWEPECVNDYEDFEVI